MCTAGFEGSSRPVAAPTRSSGRFAGTPGTLSAPAERRAFSSASRMSVALANRSHVLANGQLRVTLGPDQAGDIDTLVAAYLS